MSEIYEWSDSDEDDLSDVLIGTFFEIEQRQQAKARGEIVCGAEHGLLYDFPCAFCGAEV